MALFQNYFVDQIVLPSVIILLFLGSIFAIFVGAGLIWRSDAMFRFFATMNRWVSTRKALKPVEIPRDTSQIAKRQPRLLGTVFLLGAGVSLIVLLRQFDVAAIVLAFKGQAPAVVIDLAAQSAKWLLVAGNVLALIVGIALILFPETLARLDPRLNQWQSARASGKDLDKAHVGLDQWVQTHPRTNGWIIVVLGVFVALSLGAILVGRA